MESPYLLCFENVNGSFANSLRKLYCTPESLRYCFVHWDNRDASVNIETALF